ncbi:MAG: DUF2783 domain-containing protein [Tepidiphilus sp.]|jgi:hypothetical protein|uniref:DUF2783 domain-containing protein n=1 Tax=Tepidiphilus baoligensis TaxID=2698687 RepID=A0ABX1QP94_9PROT|nr:MULTISPECIES: DUF2783 domain-containing protein [Tepidiphilus]MBP6999820.1 DUF2783 domain-containing protein [Tepidiphilus sp.]MDD2408068.1 DUF2783 domain-containing protein [Tepidiphilus sp.]MDK2798118.1 hypothetical protein [Tepidiphilus sp.]NMH17055.1 DUF2783 domain-containing protein [Tepidiphilus baoligensis]
MMITLEYNFREPRTRTFYGYEAGDAFYEALIEAHRDLDEEQSALVNARLVLLLANHVGDVDLLREAIRLAREDVVGG